MSSKHPPHDLAASYDVVERELRQRGARFTGVCAKALLAIDLAILIVLWPGAAEARGLLVLATGSMGLMLAFVLTLVHFGRARLGAWVMTGGHLAVLGLTYWNAGIIDPAPGASVLVVILLAAVTLGRKALLLFGGLACALVVGMAIYLGLSGATVPVVRGSPVQDALALSLVCIAATVMMWVLLRAHARAIEVALVAARERDLAQIRSLEAQRMEPIGRLASGVAHDFNNLLGVIRGVSDLLRVRMGEPEAALKLLDDLDNATTRATLMTKRLLSLARQRTLGPRSSNLSAVARELAPLLERLIGDQVDLIVQDEARSAQVSISQSELEQLILNLAVNARDAMPSGGRLEVTIRDGADNMVELVVVDTGVGMSDEVLASAFAPFFTTKGTGTGLGLVTVKDIVDRAGGRLEVKSQVNHGTTFTIQFPRAEEVSPFVERPSGNGPESKLRGRLLLVEDHDLVRRTHQRLLEGLGFRVTTAVDGVEALAHIDQGAQFDIIVSDWLMPRLGGLELAEELDRRQSRVPFLLVSGDVENAPARLETLHFPAGFVMKPCTTQVLEVQIGCLLGGRSTLMDSP
jgi:signal transduction histidine kinase